MTGYALDSIGAYGYDPAFLQALNSYNLNFKSQPTDTIPTENVNNIMPQSKAEETNSSNAGIIVGGLLTVGAGALLYKAHKKGGDKGLAEGFKQIWNGLRGKGTQAATEATGGAVENATAETVTSKFSAMMGADGKLVYTIPGKTKTISGKNAVEDFANKYDIDLKKLTRFNKNSKLDGYKFVFEDGGIKNTVTVKNGEIIDIHNGTTSIKNVTESTIPNEIRFVDKLRAKVAQIEKREAGWGKGLTDVQWTTQIGDNTLKITKANLKAKTAASKVELTSLERFAEDSDAVKAYFYRNPEAKALFTSKDLTNGKLPKGMKIESYVHNFDATTKCHYKDGELVGITKGGKYFAKGSDECDAFLGENQDVLKKVIEKIFKDNKLPTDIKAVLVAA